MTDQPTDIPAPPPGTEHPTNGAAPHRDPSAETEISAIAGPDEIHVDAARSRLEGLDHIPGGLIVGLVDASLDSTTQRSHIVIDPTEDLALDEFVVTAQRLADNSVLFHYGLVVEVTGRVEGAEVASDTGRLAAAILPGERFRRAEVQWVRTVPERFLPPLSGAPVWRSTDIHRERALFLDQMDRDERLPLGLDMSGQPVFVAFSFINGDKGGHVSISGKSGVATKTSYALFLLYLLFETEWGTTVRGANAAERAVVFCVKGEDLLHLDRPNNEFFADTPKARDAQDSWRKLGVENPGPFQNVRVYAPRSEEDDRGTRVANVRTRDRRQVQVYGWTPLAFIREGLLDYVFDDLEQGQLSFIEQVVKLQLLRWAYPVEGDDTGRVVLIDPAELGETVPNSWERARRVAKRPQPAGSGIVIDDFAALSEFIAGKVLDSSPDYDPRWTGSVQIGTAQAFVRRLWGAEPRLRAVIAAGLTVVDRSAPISVIDIHSLHEDAQRFVVGAVLASVWAEHESSQAAGRSWILLDELNKYAPRQGRSPIKHLLVDIAGRGRSLGVLLLGAQQNPSGVDPNITGNAALHVVGQIRAQEATELGFLPTEMRNRAQLIAPGTMITSQPLIPAPIPVRFPFPPYATRVAEVAEDPGEREEARGLLGDM